MYKYWIDKIVWLSVFYIRIPRDFVSCQSITNCIFFEVRKINKKKQLLIVYFKFIRNCHELQGSQDTTSAKGICIWKWNWHGSYCKTHSSSLDSTSYVFIPWIGWTSRSTVGKVFTFFLAFLNTIFVLKKSSVTKTIKYYLNNIFLI